MNLGVVNVSEATSNGSTSTLIDSSLENGDDLYNGGFVVFTSGTNGGEIRVVDDYTGSTTTLTLRGDVLPAATADGDQYELWPRDMPPARIHDFINRAIRTITRKGAPNAEDLSLHTTQYQRVYAKPSGIIGVARIDQRVLHTKLVVHHCDSA